MENPLYYNNLLMLFVFTTYVLHVNRATFSCTHSFEKRELLVDCSNMGLQYMPQFISVNTDNMVYLNLQHNKFFSIENNWFKNMRNLTVLDLSFNRLSYISKKAFKRLKKLQKLRLNDNKLKYDTRAFPIRSFQPLKSLKLLSIENNGATSSSSFPDKTIAHLTKLETLKMDILEPEKKSTIFFGKEYCKLPHLYSLHLMIKSTGLGHIQLNNTFFQNTPSLIQLHFLLFTPVFFDTFTLSTLDKLKMLQIDYGNVRIPEIFTNGLNREVHYLLMLHKSILELISKVSNSSTEILIIQNLLPDYLIGVILPFCVRNLLYKCLDTSIRQLHFTNIFGLEQDHCTPTQSVFKATRNLQLLNLTRNDFTGIALDLPDVVTLDLKHNRLGKYLVNNNYMITQSSKLEDISLSHNLIYQLNTDIFKGQPYLKHIDLRSFNKISNISNDFSHLEKLQILNLANNEIKILTKNQCKKLIDCFKKQ